MNLIEDKLILNLRKINSSYLEIWPELNSFKLAAAENLTLFLSVAFIPKTLKNT